jgi:hypothetical protein
MSNKLSQKRTKSTRMKIGDICAALGRTENGIRRQMQAAGITADANHTYDFADVKRAMEAAAARDKRADGGLHADRKGRKLDVEIEILELKRDEIRRELVPVSEMLGQISEVAGILRWGAEQFPALMGVETKDPAAVAVAEKVRDRIVARLTEKLEEAGIAAA